MNYFYHIVRLNDFNVHKIRFIDILFQKRLIEFPTLNICEYKYNMVKKSLSTANKQIELNWIELSISYLY